MKQRPDKNLIIIGSTATEPSEPISDTNPTSTANTGSGMETTTNTASNSATPDSTPVVNGTQETEKEKKMTGTGISAGGLAGIAITIVILVPLLTYMGYVFWSKKAGRRSFIGTDEEPVIAPEQTETYT